MRKLTIYALILTIMLWAAHPMALAVEYEWLTSGTAPEETETAPEPENSGEWATPSMAAEDAATVPENEPVEWTVPGETPVEADPEPEEVSWLDIKDVPEDSVNEGTPAPRDNVEWLTSDAMPMTASMPMALSLDEETEIDVDIPGTGQMVINPHRLRVDLGGFWAQDQVYNSRQILTNHSSVPIKVSASATVDTSQSGGVSVANGPVAADERDKLAYFYVEFQNMTSGTAEPQWSGEYTGAENQVLAASSGAQAKDVLDVEAGSESPTYAAYRVFGSLSENPDNAWRYGDKLSVTVSFTFRSAVDTQQNEGAEAAAEQAEESERTEEPAETEAEPEEALALEDDTGAKPEENPEMAEEVPETVEQPADNESEESETESPEETDIESFASMVAPNWMAAQEAG